LAALADAMMTEKQRPGIRPDLGNESRPIFAGGGAISCQYPNQRGSVGMVIRRIKADVSSLDGLGAARRF